MGPSRKKRGAQGGPSRARKRLWAAGAAGGGKRGIKPRRSRGVGAREAMLAAVGAVAAVLGQGYVWEPGGCEILGHTWRGTTEMNILGTTVTLCCATNSDKIDVGSCYGKDETGSMCRVSTETHRCCVYDPRADDVGCYNYGQNECNSDNSDLHGTDVQWCPLLTEEEPGPSSGATAGIVVGGILGPFALGLAYKSLMYK